MSMRFTADHILDYINLDGCNAIFEVEIPEQWVGKTVDQIDIRKKYGINIMATKENGEMNLTILPETVLTSKITLLVLGEHKAIQKCFHI